MGRGDDVVTRTVYEVTLALRVCSPEDEYEVFPLLGQTADGRVGKRLPALVLMRGWSTCIDRQSGVGILPLSRWQESVYPSA